MTISALGIIGSGQLGSLLCQAAKKLNIKTINTLYVHDSRQLLNKNGMIVYRDLVYLKKN